MDGGARSVCDRYTVKEQSTEVTCRQAQNQEKRKHESEFKRSPRLVRTEIVFCFVLLPIVLLRLVVANTTPSS